MSTADNTLATAPVVDEARDRERAQSTALHQKGAWLDAPPANTAVRDRRGTEVIQAELADAGERIKALEGALARIRDRAICDLPELESPPENRLQTIYVVAVCALADFRPRRR